MITILQGMAEQRILEVPDSSIHLTVTSPPYSNQRHYAAGHDYDFQTIAKELYRVTCEGGIVAWNEGLTCRKFDEESMTYEHVLRFKTVGFKLLQTIIIRKDSIPFPGKFRCGNQFEFCWLLLKGSRPRVFHKLELKDRPNKQAGQTKNVAVGRRGKDDAIGKTGKPILIQPLGYRSNVWDVPVGFNKSTHDKIAYEHPAIQSESVSDALIRAYTKSGDYQIPGDTVFDPFSGSGTTLKMATVNGREAIGLERSRRYVRLAAKRLKPYCKDIEIK
jgi:DNA modification methylase